MRVEDITNYIKISDCIASSGQQESYQFKDIAFAGYKVVITLAMSNSGRAIPEEGNIAAAHEMKYIHLPIPYESPNVDHLGDFLRIMMALSGQKTWVLCVVNYRVSAFLYQHERIVHGATPEEAKKICCLPGHQTMYGGTLWRYRVKMLRYNKANSHGNVSV